MPGFTLAGVVTAPSELAFDVPNTRCCTPSWNAMFAVTGEPPRLSQWSGSPSPFMSIRPAELVIGLDAAVPCPLSTFACPSLPWYLVGNV